MTKDSVASTIAVVDYGAGNVSSVLKAFRAVGGEPRIVSQPAELAGAAAVIIPGVGHFAATRALGDDWRRVLVHALDAGVPLLGICLGMQWLYDGSEEAPDERGLGVFPGRCVRLPDQAEKVPHVGWNLVTPTPAPSRLLHGLAAPPAMYFTHTYAAPANDFTTALTTHGHSFASVVERGNVYGVQCHPEKSGSAGLTMLECFMTVVREAGRAC